MIGKKRGLMGAMSALLALLVALELLVVLSLLATLSLLSLLAMLSLFSLLAVLSLLAMLSLLMVLSLMSLLVMLSQLSLLIVPSLVSTEEAMGLEAIGAEAGGISWLSAAVAVEMGRCWCFWWCWLLAMMPMTCGVLMTGQTASARRRVVFRRRIGIVYGSRVVGTVCCCVLRCFA